MFFWILGSSINDSRRSCKVRFKCFFCGQKKQNLYVWLEKKWGRGLHLESAIFNCPKKTPADPERNIPQTLNYLFMKDIPSYVCIWVMWGMFQGSVGIFLELPLWWGGCTWFLRYHWHFHLFNNRKFSLFNPQFPVTNPHDFGYLKRSREVFSGFWGGRHWDQITHVYLEPDSLYLFGGVMFLMFVMWIGIFMFEGRVIIFWLRWNFKGCTQKWFFHWHHLWNTVFFSQVPFPSKLHADSTRVWDFCVLAGWVELPHHVEPSFLFASWSWIFPLIVGKLADFAQLKLVVWPKIPRLRHPPEFRSVLKFDLLWLTRFLVLGIYL